MQEGSALMTREDFVAVRLSPAGEAAAAGGVLRLAGGVYEFEFRAGEVRQVTRGEWEGILSRETAGGEPLFELAEGNET